jgi:serine/threonine protein kinase
MIDQLQSLLSSLEKNYTIEKEVGRGGMGVVYKGLDKRLERPVAIKVLNLGGGGESSQSQRLHNEAVERFRREAKVVARLSHPNIVSIYDVGEENNQYYMIMEFAEGKPLSSLIGEGRLVPAPVAASVAAQVCSALAYAHENQIIHRDIKPANIILSPKGTAKLMDFGIAQLHTEGAKLTQAGSVMGSIMYTSPEQLNDASRVDARTDLYALGVTIYELLTGQSPYKADSMSQLILEILTAKEEPNPLRRINADVPEVLELIVERAMKKVPDDRYSSAQEMGTDLSRLLNTGQFTASTHFNLSFNEGEGSTTTQSRSASRLKDSTLMRKTSVDNELVKALKARREWIRTLLSEWKTENVSALGLKPVLAKLMEPSLVGPAFSGVLVIDAEIYLLVEQGLFVGAVNLLTGDLDAAVFSHLPEKPKSLELCLPPEGQNSAPALLAQILADSGQAIQQNLDSSLMDLLPLIENLSSSEESFTGYVTCHARQNIFYYGYENGKQLFAVQANPEIVATETWLELKTLAEEEGVLVDIYKPVPRLVGPSLNRILAQTQLLFNYADSAKTTLQTIVDMGSEEIPIHLIQEAKHNVQLQLQHPQSANLKVLGQALNTQSLVESSLHLRFSQWMIREYFYLLNSSGSINTLKYIYSWIPAIEYLAFEESLQGDDGKMHAFNLVAHGQVKGEKLKKVLSLICFGSGTEAEVNDFIDRVISVKKQLIKSGDIGGALYISSGPFDTDALKLFYARTVEPRKGLMGSLDTLTKYKGFVRIGMNRGFHLNLIEHRKDNQSFEVIAPLLK